MWTTERNDAVPTLTPRPADPARSHLDAESMVSRVALILGAFTPADEALGPSELARRTGLAKSTTARIAAELTQYRLLERAGSGFRLGLRLFELGESAARPLDLRRLALPSMADLRNAVGLTVHLAVLEGTEVVYLEILPARGVPRLPSRMGGRMPAYATGVGKALLAAAPPETVDAVVAGGLVARTPDTITSAERLRRELARVRQTGVAYEREESAPGVACAASVVRGGDGDAIAAISAAGWSKGFDGRRVALAVRTAAESVTRQARTRTGWTFHSTDH